MPLSQSSVRSTFTVLSVTAVVAVAAVALLAKPQPVQAYQAYSQKEAVKCGYCHVRAAGGGPRNYRGKFYKQNGLTFNNFDDAAEAKAAGEPLAPEADAKPTSGTKPPATPDTTPTEPAATPTPEATPAPATPKASPVPGLRTKAAATAAALKKAPKSVPAKKAHSAALTALAKGIMNDGSIVPVTKKHAEALTLARQAVALDSANKGAAAIVSQITAVYKQMGRPLPK